MIPKKNCWFPNGEGEVYKLPFDNRVLLVCLPVLPPGVVKFIRLVIINTRLYGWWGVHKWLMNISAESAFRHIEFIIIVKNMQRSLFPAVCPHDPPLAP